MTEKEAWVVLNADEGDDDAQELMDDCLFEIKQFVLSKAIISKLYSSQITKLEKLKMAAIVLKLEVSKPSIPSDLTIELVANDSFMSTFNAFEKNKSYYKQQVVKTSIPSELSDLISKLIDLQSDYSNQWPIIEVEESEGVVISKETDAMQLLVEFNKMNEAGIIAFQQLTQNSLDNYPNVNQELKRLSLLRKKEKEWKTSLKN